MKRFALSRRALLRGAGGAVLGLPLLEAMLPSREALAQAGQVKRYLLMTSGQATGRDGASDNYFTPNVGALAGQTMRPALAGLSDVLGDFTLVSGLQIPSQGLDGHSGIPAGGKPRATHDKTLSPLLSGKAQPTDGAYGAAGPTSDYLVAQGIGSATTFRQINYRVQQDEINGHYAEISYSAANRPVNNSVADPAVAWATLFESFVPPSSSPAPVDPTIARASLRRRSVLDAVLQSSASLSSRLGLADRSRLSDHLDQVRDLERRVAQLAARTDPGGSGALTTCVKPTKPGTFATGTQYNDEIKRGDVLVDLIAMALACDLTRVATLLISFSMPMFRLPGHDIDVHEESHQSNTHADFVASQQWHVGLFGRMLRALKATPEGNGSVLDSTALIFALEAGHGRDAAATGTALNAHSTDNMIMLVAGSAGGRLKMGQHIRPAAVGGVPRHPASVLITAMNAVGVGGTTLGDVSGAIPELQA